MNFIELTDEQLKKLRKVHLEILDEITRICNMHEIKFFLIGGSLLGAVRHQGYIPWDDDLDIAMTRNDYDKFVELCKTNLSDKYYLDDISTNKKYWLPFIKIRKNGTLFKEKSNEHMHGINRGIYVDVFPIDNIKTANGLMLKIQAYVTRSITYTYMLKSKIKVNKSNILAQFLRIFSFKFLHKLQDFMCKLYNDKDTKYVTNFASPYNYKKEVFLRDDYYPAVEYNFEDRKILGVRAYDKYLTQVYGEYMKLPPQENRVNHSVVSLDFGSENK